MFLRNPRAINRVNMSLGPPFPRATIALRPSAAAARVFQMYHLWYSGRIAIIHDIFTSDLYIFYIWFTVEMLQNFTAENVTHIKQHWITTGLINCAKDKRTKGSVDSVCCVIKTWITNGVYFINHLHANTHTQEHFGLGAGSARWYARDRHSNAKAGVR